MFKRLLSGLAIGIGITTSFLAPSEAFGGDYYTSRSVSTSDQFPTAGAYLFELSLGYNYLYLENAFPESENLHGVDLSAFINLNSWLSLGGEFMADFGSETQQFGGPITDFDSRRYIYVFGPRVSVWQNSRFRLFVQALAGGVHAELEATSVFFDQTATADGFAAAAGIGADWRFTPHLSWRVIQADYVPTELEGEWQHNFRLSSGIVYSFGSR